MTILSVIAYLITILSSLIFDSNDITTPLLILSFIMIVSSLIGSVLGIMQAKSYHKESKTVTINALSINILTVLLIVNILILLRAIVWAIAILTFS
jgi:hypothetical protein